MSLKHIFTSLLWLCTSVAWAQEEFLPVRASDYPITDDTVPTCTLQQDVGSLSPDSIYSIRVEYPETMPLTRQELRRLKKQGYEAKALPDVETYMAVSRKRGYAVCSFVPIVRRDGKLRRIVSCKISVTATPKTRRAAVRGTAQVAGTTGTGYAPHSVLSEGKWVKIRVKEEGIYELTASKLKDMGFSDISRVKVFGYGGRILPTVLPQSGEDALTDDLEEVPLYRKANSVLFFAEGTVRWTFDTATKRWRHQQNTYSDYSYYFVTEGDSPATLESYTPDAAAGSATTQVVGHALRDEDAYGWYEGGTEMYDSYDFVNGNSHTFRLTAEGCTSDSAAGTVDIGFSAANTLSSTTASVSLGAETLGTITVSAYGENENARESRATFATSSVARENSFAFTTTEGHNARLNYIRLSYPRQLDATSTPFAFVPYQDGRAIELDVTNASQTTQLWKLGYTGVPTLSVSGSLEGSLFRVVADEPGRRYVIVDVGRDYDAPEVVGTIDNQDLHADSAADMVIIIPESGKLLAQAQRLADAHTAEGLRVRIVRADKIYNEFSSGTPDATAYRRYLKMLYDRATTEADMPRYLLLFGDCAWDNRMHTSDWRSYAPRDFLLAFEVSPSDRTTNIPVGTLNSYVTDDYFGFLDDGEGGSITTRDKLDIAIGRLPCHDESTAKVLVDKTLAYLQNDEVGAWKNRLVMIADNNWQSENNIHMRSSEVVSSGIRAVAGDLYTIKKVYPDAYTYTTSATGNTFPSVTRMLQEEMKRGALMFNYMGHGSPDQISHCKLLLTADFATSSAGRLPVWVFASCEITPYDMLEDDIGRAALYNEDGGAVAVMCASRSVYANYNEVLNLNFSRNALSASAADGRLMPLGEALRQAKVTMVNAGSDRTMNKLKYCLLGDPALSFAAPLGSITLDSINGLAVEEADSIQLKAGAKVRFAGSVKDAAGAVDDTFTGVVTGTLFDRLETITCKNNGGGASSPMTYQDRRTTLYEGSDSVRDGRFALVVTIPRDISYSTASGRLDLYAVSQDRSRECHGTNSQFYFNGTATEVTTDTLGPRIYVWLNAADFPNGGYVQRDALLGATLSDTSGIHSAGGSIGHDLELVLDGETSAPIVLNDYFTYDFGSSTSGTISYPMEGLSEGRHTLALRAWDLCDNSATAYLTFFVTDNLPDAYDVNATNNPAYSSTSFITTLEADQDSRVTTEVYDLQGRLVWQKSGSATGATYYTVTWDLTTQGGVPVDAGIYIFRSVVRSAAATHETKSKKMIVVRQ